MASVYILKTKNHPPRAVVFVVDSAGGSVSQRNLANGTICIDEFCVGGYDYKVGCTYPVDRLRDCWNQLTESGYWIRGRELEDKWTRIVQGA